MTITVFKASLSEKTPPAGLNELAQALWHDAQGDWHKAHEIAQSNEGHPRYDALHAYLHRKEGDQWNANYWYRRAGRKMPATSLDAEWEALVIEFL
ncbi:MAG: hypothetical protein U0Y10_11855 [Spirosomataceae bacterium]